ncbi:hypothetical protein J6590_022703 [Homalodisca vitripennis]|nr:hypothetical protein J6590_022703 [Homalodisca vitripennis]
MHGTTPFHSRVRSSPDFHVAGTRGLSHTLQVTRRSVPIFSILRGMSGKLKRSSGLRHHGQIEIYDGPQWSARDLERSDNYGARLTGWLRTVDRGPLDCEPFLYYQTVLATTTLQVAINQRRTKKNKMHYSTLLATGGYRGVDVNRLTNCSIEAVK